MATVEISVASFEEDGAAIFDLVNQCYSVETGNTGMWLACLCVFVRDEYSHAHV